MDCNYHIRDAETESDREAVRALLTRAFDVQPGVGAAFAQLYDQVSNAQSRVAIGQGRVVGHALLAARPFFVARRRVPGGILAMVAVDRDHRGKGVGAALVRDAMAQGRARHMELLHVAGDPHFYMRFGFVPAYVWATAEIPAASGRPGGDLRAAIADDVDRLAELSARESPAGGVLPDADRWRWVLDTGHPAELLKRNDRMLGFRATGDACWLLDEVGFVRACWRADTLAIYEAAAVDEAAGARLLNAVCSRAGGLGCAQVKCFLSPKMRLMEAVARCGVSMDIRENGEQLACALDIRGLLTRLAPVLSRRIWSVGWTGTLGVRFGHNHLKLEIGRSGLALRPAGEKTIGTADWQVALPEIALTRAILGTDRLSKRLGNQAETLLCTLVDALFPEQMPFFPLSDAL